MAENKIPKISLLIYTYNRADILENAIKSVLNQTYQDFELVLINNGSTDHTREVLEKYADHPNVRIIHLEKNIGSHGGFRFAFDQIRGEWFTVMTDDDTLVEHALETLIQVPELIDPTINAVSCNTICPVKKEWNGQGLDKDQYLPLEKILKQTTGEFFGITKTELLGDKRPNPKLFGTCNTFWHKIDAIANRYYIHQALLNSIDVEGDNETTRQASMDSSIKSDQYKELLNEEFYWDVLQKYNRPQFMAKCIRGMYFLKMKGIREGAKKYMNMLKNSQPGLKHRLLALFIWNTNAWLLSSMYNLAGKNNLSVSVFRLFVKRHSMIGR